MTTVYELVLPDLLDNLVKNFVQVKIELLMKEELSNYLHVEQPNHWNSRDGTMNELCIPVMVKLTTCKFLEITMVNIKRRCLSRINDVTVGLKRCYLYIQGRHGDPRCDKIHREHVWLPIPSDYDH